jgi:hypothetical protein
VFHEKIGKYLTSSYPETDKMGQFLGPVTAIIAYRKKKLFLDPKYIDKKERHVRFLCHLLEYTLWLKLQNTAQAMALSCFL